MKQLKILTFILFYLLTNHLSAQSDNSNSFLAEWEGRWTGNLEIFSPAGLVQSIPMELHILPLDSVDYSWTIIYGEDKETGKRAYLIRPKDISTGHYTIDEKNTILLDAYWLGGKLFERFEVMDNLLLTSTEMVDNRLVFEVISGSLNNLQSSGGEVFEGEEIPEVKSYPIQIRQVARLVRQ